MANTLSVANGPVEFTDPATGGLTVVPVGALTFDTSGNAVVATPYTTQPDLTNWLNYLVQSGAIQAAPAAAPSPAFTIASATPGSQGNNISVNVAITTPNADPTLVVFSVTVTQTDSYTNLSPANIKTILGTQTLTGKQPGLVHVLDADVPTLPAKMASATAATGGNGTTKAALPIPGDPSGTAFNVQARAVGADGGLIKIAIPTVDKTDPLHPTFSLTATWSKAAAGVTIATIAAKLADLGYVTAVSPPGSGAFSLPSANGGAAYQLSGGADGALPSSASAVIPAGV